MQRTPELEVKHERVASAGAEALVIFITPAQLDRDSLGLPPKILEEIRRLGGRNVFTAKRGQTLLIPTHAWMDYSYVILGGLELSEGLEDIRTAAALAVKKGLHLHIATYEVRLPDWDGFHPRDVAQAVTEGFLLGAYRRTSYRTVDRKEGRLERLVIRIADVSVLADVQKGVDKGRLYAEATNYARDLTNLPGNRLIPQQLADEAVQLAEKLNLDCSVLDETAIREMKMGGLLAVGQGSVHPPRMIVLKYQGKDEWSDVTAIVGKGITFDTGGISLKKREGMEEMVSDMAGAAAVLGAMKGIGTIRPKANILAVIPAAENMPSGNAYKPGDIITTMSGRTIEVLNTDAEGRIVLADAVTYAKQLGASRIIDLATLTGAILICLGDVATGAVTNDESFLRDFLLAARKTGEKIWQLPSYREFWEMIRSPVADVKNSAGRWGASITAGLFIGTFAEQTPWIHLDIAGTSWLNKERGIDPEGGTGVMVRTLLEFLCGEL